MAARSKQIAVRAKGKHTQKGKQIQVCVALPPKTVDAVKQLSKDSRVPMAAYFREALEALLDRYRPGWR